MNVPVSKKKSFVIVDMQENYTNAIATDELDKELDNYKEIIDFCINYDYPIVFVTIKDA